MNAHPPPPSGELQQALDLFRAQFAEQMPARLAELRDRLAAWQAAPASQEALRDLHRVLHRLAGSAGTFGMPAFGEACRAIELRLEALQQRPPGSGAERAQVAIEIAALERLVVRA